MNKSYCPECEETLEENCFCPSPDVEVQVLAYDGGDAGKDTGEDGSYTHITHC